MGSHLTPYTHIRYIYIYIRPLLKEKQTCMDGWMDGWIDRQIDGTRLDLDVRESVALSKTADL